MQEFFDATAWPMTPPVAYGPFHILFMVFGFAACYLLARRLCRLSDRGARILLLISGVLLTVFELYKQLFYYYHIGNGEYQWWIFPFQLCSVPMYLCIAAALLPEGSVRRGMLCFMGSYNLLGGAIAFLEPSGLCHEYWTLTLHAFVWHMMLVFVGMFIVMSGRACRKSADFRLSTFTFLGLSVIAFALNLIFRRVSNGDINMFFVGPSDNPLIVFKDIAVRCGWYVATLLYIPVVILGAWLVYRLIRLYYDRLDRRAHPAVPPAVPAAEHSDEKEKISM